MKMAEKKNCGGVHSPLRKAGSLKNRRFQASIPPYQSSKSRNYAIFKLKRTGKTQLGALSL
jgi:hypothetical protein